MIIVGGYLKCVFCWVVEFGVGWYGFVIDLVMMKDVFVGFDVVLVVVGCFCDGFEIIIILFYKVIVDMVKEFEDLGVDCVVV